MRLYYVVNGRIVFHGRAVLYQRLSNCSPGYTQMHVYIGHCYFLGWQSKMPLLRRYSRSKGKEDQVSVSFCFILEQTKTFVIGTSWHNYSFHGKYIWITFIISKFFTLQIFAFERKWFWSCYFIYFTTSQVRS